MNEDELFEKGASRMQNGDLERLQVVELADVGPGGFEHIAEQGADRHRRVRMGPAPDARLEEHAGADKRGRLSGGGVGDLVGAMPASLAAPDPIRRAADTGGRGVGHGLNEPVSGAAAPFPGYDEDVDVFGEASTSRYLLERLVPSLKMKSPSKPRPRTRRTRLTQ